MEEHVFTRPRAPRTGRRALPPGLQAQWDLAARTPLPRVARSRASLAFKSVAPRLGVRGTAYALMDKLIGLTPKMAFERGEAPIVTANNRMLADALDVDVRTIQMCLARLISLGVIIPKDSENLKRGERQGERFGFDLSPLARRFDEFVELAARERAERGLVAHLRGAITRDRNACLAEIETLEDRELAAAYEDRTAQLYGRREKVSDPGLLADIRIGLHRLKTELIGLNSSPLGEENVAHHRDTDYERVSYETTEDACPRAAEPPAAPGREAELASTTEQDKTPRRSEPSGAIRLSPERIAEMVPALCCYATGGRLKWSDVEAAAEPMTVHIGLRAAAWTSACGAIGRQAALAVLIVVLARHERGEVRNPAGLFVRMCQLSARGQLRLERSLFALMKSPDARNGPSGSPFGCHA